MLHWLNRFDLAKAKTVILVVFCAFAGFVVAFGAFARLTDPRAPFDSIAQTHPEISLLFQLVNIGFQLACLAVVVGGLPILYDVIKRSLAERRKSTLLLIILPLLALVVAIGDNALVFNLLLPGGVTPANSTPLNIFLTFSAQALFLLAAVACLIGVTIAVVRSEVSPRILRFALALAVLVILPMLLTLIATILWSVRIWMDAPQLFNNGAIALGLLPGVAWLLLIMAAMAIIIGIPIAALIRNLPKQANAHL